MQLEHLNFVDRVDAQVVVQPTDVVLGPERQVVFRVKVDERAIPRWELLVLLAVVDGVLDVAHIDKYFVVVHDDGRVAQSRSAGQRMRDDKRSYRTARTKGNACKCFRHKYLFTETYAGCTNPAFESDMLF